jgi:hypothetical protein
MHDVGAPAWREIVEKSHARLIEELTAAVDSDRRRAVDAAVAAEREAARAERETANAEREVLNAERDALRAELQTAKAELVASREEANAEITALRESTKTEIDALTAKAKAEADSLRRNATAEMEAFRAKANAEKKGLRESATAEANALRENATAEVNALRESASAEANALRATSKADLDALRESSNNEIQAARAKADAAIAAVTEKAAAETESLRRNAKTEIDALRESVNAEKIVRQKAEEQLAAESERAAKLLAREREHAGAELKSTRERATADLKSERERSATDLNSARERASSELNKVRTELTEGAGKAKIVGRQTMAEAINQSLRRIRQATSVESTLQFAAELSSAYAHKAVVLVFENNQARVAAVRPASGTAVLPAPVAAATSAPAAPVTINGAGADRAPEANHFADQADAAFDFTLENAPALASAIETRDPVTALGRESEISAALARLLDVAPAEKVYLFPIIARQQVVAMLVVAGEVLAAAPELLAEAAGMRLESITETVKKTPSPENLVTIKRVAAPVPGAPDRHNWDDLSLEDQQLHLQAQRVARVRVAKMRLEREEAWRRGLAQSDVYGALRRDIESARTEFLQTFLSRSSTMVDYLHLEILRSLANEDDRVLGREYPGPMV